MTKKILLLVPVAPVLKGTVEEIFAALGLTPTTAINLFLQQVVLQQGLPFPQEKLNAKTRAALSAARQPRQLTACQTAAELFQHLGI